MNTVDNKLLPMRQSVYLAFHSTETSRKKDGVSLLVLLDLSAAFDTVDDELLEALEHLFCIGSKR